MLRTIQFVAVTAAALCIGAAPAFSAPKNQEPAFEEPHGADLNQGKPPSEIFKSDCSVCHKSPQGLAKGGGVAGLQSFLRQHYTTGAPQAAAMASYLASVGGGGSAKPVSPTRPEKPEKPEKPERASPEHQRPAVARRPAAGEPANDGLITPNSAKPEAEPAHPARRGVRPEKPEEPKQAPARARAPKIEEAKPAEPEKREVVSEPAPRSSEPAAAPAPEPKPAAPAVPEIPL
ncbi:MAG TPA: hypothetical protein VHA55_08775 [Pseudorhodoplanes sp.]|nr:hypothetical protein [Pseudorhodoplanes sp.]